MDYKELNNFLASLTVEEENKDKEKIELNKILLQRNTAQQYKPEFKDNRITGIKPIPVAYSSNKEIDKKFNVKKNQVNFNDKLSERHMSSLTGNGPPPILDHFSKNSRDI